MKKYYILMLIMFSLFFFSNDVLAISKKLSGKILLQVEEKGEAWYVYPKDQKRYFLGKPKDAFDLMRKLSIGVSNETFVRFYGFIPNSKQDKVLSPLKESQVNYLSGQILLQAEGSGEAYYLNPEDLKAYYLGRPVDAFNIMREKSLGILNIDLEQIEIGAIEIEKNDLMNKVDYTNLEETIEKSSGDPREIREKCKSNTNPIFVSDITDINNIFQITPPGGERIQIGDVLTHSHIWNSSKNSVPVYAPVDSILKGGSFYREQGMDQYLLFFEVSCEVTYKFDHIKDPLEAIQDFFPEGAKLNDSRIKELPPLRFKAGDLIAYTDGTKNAHNWDFGVYNSSIKNFLIENDKYNWSDMFTSAVCPYDYYEEDKKDFYYNLIIPGSLKDFCKF